jgi:hypothetical protein
MLAPVESGMSCVYPISFRVRKENTFLCKRKALGNKVAPLKACSKPSKTYSEGVLKIHNQCYNVCTTYKSQWGVLYTTRGIRNVE